jgi:hypothetical protein
MQEGDANRPGSGNPDVGGYEARCRYPTRMRMEIILASSCSSGYFQVKPDAALRQRWG